MVKHKIIIHQVNGRITHISASGCTEVYLAELSIGSIVVSKLDPDIEFESGKAHEIYQGELSKFLKKHKV